MRCRRRAPRRVRKASVVRERRATFSLAPGQPSRPRDRHTARGVLPGRRLDRYRIAGYDRERRDERPPRRRGGVGWKPLAVHACYCLNSRGRIEPESRIPSPESRVPSHMTSIVVHYQEIALKGRNRPCFISKLVHNLRKQTADLGVKDVRALDGADRDRARPVGELRRRRGTGQARVRHRELLEGRPRGAGPWTTSPTAILADLEGHRAGRASA